MNIYLYISLIFGISLVFYLLGYHPVGFDLLTEISQNGLTIDALLENLGRSTKGLIGIFGEILGIAIISSFVLGSGSIGNTLWLFIKMSAILLAVNFFVLPTEIIAGAGLPTEISMVIMAFLNVLTLLVVISVIE